ncbi:MAG: nuclease SbcCD, subunit [Frankiales bacterium]|nr:nuclease SbcCD, subunit [Frankiales bacterium]
MRFLHTSDWHLGRTLHGVDLLEAQAAVLQQLIELVADPPGGTPVDAVVIAGDIFDRAVPPIEAVTLFEAVLAALAEHCTVIVTAGNHDSAVRLGYGSGLFTDRVRVRTTLDSVGEPVLLDGVACYPLPYLDPDAARRELQDGSEVIERSHQGVMAAAMRRVRADLASRPAGTPSVVIAHAFVVGGQPSESERSIVVGGVDSVAAETFAGIDYVALGHLHGAQQPRSNSATVLRYSGSPLRYSFSEQHHEKSATLVDIGPAGNVVLTVVALRQPRAMADLTATLDELLHDVRFARHSQDWVRATVTDRARPEQLFERLAARFPHVLQIRHLPNGVESSAAVPSIAAAEKSPAELAQSFITAVTGTTADEAEIALFVQAHEIAQAGLAVAGEIGGT